MVSTERQALSRHVAGNVAYNPTTSREYSDFDLIGLWLQYGNKGDYCYICSTENMGWGSLLTTLIISIQRKKEKL